MKSSLVSYHTTPYKALALPADGSPVVFEDFSRFMTGEPSPLSTRAELSREGDFLHLKVFCDDPEPGSVIATNTPGCRSLWSGDILEIFFGAIAPEPWQIQLCVGAGGGRFDTQGRYDEWSAHTELTPTGWQADIRIPLGFLMLQDLSVGFNLCRQAPAHKLALNWSLVKCGFHEAENYGEIFFCDYDTAYLAKTGASAPHAGLTRAEFEDAMSKLMTPAWQVAHGPFLLNPDHGRISIGWDTAGMCGALLEYREAGASEWIVHPADECNGVLEQSHRSHRIELNGLKPGARYEYRLKSVRPVSETLETFPAEGAFSFTTFSPGRTTYSFGLCSDLHSNEKHFRDLLELPGSTGLDFWVVLGDILSHASGETAFYTGFLDTAVRLYAKEKPLVFVRGNHEQIGLFASSYSLLGHFSGHTWYLFRQGRVCFAALDAGNDHPDEPGQGIHRNDAMTREEAAWLAEAARTPAWTDADFRVVLVHIPPFSREHYDSQMTLRLLAAVPAEVPQPDLLLGGHVHKYFRLMPGQPPHTPLGPHRSVKDRSSLPFPVIANDTCTGLFVDVTPDSLTVTARKADGSEVDTLRIGRKTR